MLYKIHPIISSSFYLFFDNVYREDVEETIKVIKETYDIIHEEKGVLLDKSGRYIFLPYLKKKGVFVPVSSIDEFLMDTAACTLDLLYETSESRHNDIDRITVTKIMKKRYEKNPNLLEKLYIYNQKGYNITADTATLITRLKTPLKITPLIEEDGVNFIKFIENNFVDGHRYINKVCKFKLKVVKDD